MEAWRTYRDERDERAAALLEFAAEEERRRAEVLDSAYGDYLSRRDRGEYAGAEVMGKENADASGADVLDTGSVGYAQAVRDFDRAVVAEFAYRWAGPDAHAYRWGRAYARLLDDAHLHFARAAQRAHELAATQKALDFWEASYRRDGEVLPEDASVPTDLAHYETEAWKEASYRTEGTRPRPGEEGHVPTSVSELRADVLVRTRGVVDRAFGDFPHDHVARQRAILRETAELRDSLRERVGLLADATRRVDAAMARFDTTTDPWPEDWEEDAGHISTGALDDANRARLREEFRRDLYTFDRRIIDEIRTEEIADADEPGYQGFSERWEDLLQVAFDRLGDRVEHAEFRQFRNADFERVIQEAFTR
jgi:hypothetical protein